MAGRDNNITLENQRIIWKNFEGREEPYNASGNRHFTIALDSETAEMLRRDGWAVKSKPGREEGDEELHTLKVKVKFGSNGRGARVIMISSRGRTTLNEDLAAMLDFAALEYSDMIIRPYDWKMSGKTGRTAYLVAIYATLFEDDLEKKYAHVKEVSSGAMPLSSEFDFDEGEDFDDD